MFGNALQHLPESNSCAAESADGLVRHLTFPIWQENDYRGPEMEAYLAREVYMISGYYVAVFQWRRITASVVDNAVV